MVALFDPLILARALHFAATLQLFGLVLFRAGVAWPAETRDALTALAWAAFALMIGSGFWWVWLVAAQAGAEALWQVATNTQFGRAMLARGLMACVCFGFLPTGEGRIGWFGFVPSALRDASRVGTTGWVIVLLWAALAGSLAFTGHASASTTTHLVADVAHILAAGAWLGALLPLAFVLARANGDIRPVVRRFSTLGVVSVVALAVTGCVNGWFLAGGLPGLIGTQWGLLLCSKLLLFGLMLIFAAFNRLRLTPSLTPSLPAAALALRRNAIVEAGLGCAVIVVVAWLGATSPAAHTPPVWPLTWRIDANAFYAAPEIANAAWRCALLLVGAAAFLIVAALWRRARWVFVAAGLAALAIAAPQFGVLTTAASPTTFQNSPAGFSAQIISDGAAHFSAHCANCHGERGAGNGPAAAGLAKKPADLTQDHLFAHFDGDLFWWISNGLSSMPGFAGVLDEAARWSLVDFLHANADGVRLAALNGRVAGAAFPLPEFAMKCVGLPATSSADLLGEALHIIIAGPGAENRLRQLSFLAGNSEMRTIVVKAGAAVSASQDWRPCEAEDEALLRALAVYRAAAPEALDGTEFLVDAQGRLRSMWHKGMASDWRDPLVFRRAIAEMKVPQELARALSAVNAAPGGPRIDFDLHGHRH